MIEELEKGILDPSLFSISLVGMGKNTGKTVTLNFLINMLRSKRLGITSIGIDGERIDNLTYTPKPSIKVTKDTIIATASGTLEELNAGYEILEGTGIYNPLGEILIIRLLEEGEVLIGGPERTRDLANIIGIFKRYNCEKALIDGAIDRKASASPYITDAMVFVTGASYSRDINRLIKETVHKVNMLTLPAIDARFEKILSEYYLKHEMTLITGDKIRVLPYKSALLAKEITKYFSSELENTLLIPGALLDSFMLEIISMLKNGYRIRIIVKDGTKVFLSVQVYQEYTELGGELKVFRRNQALGIAVNPVSIEGYEFDSDTLVSRLRLFVGIPVFDPLR